MIPPPLPACSHQSFLRENKRDCRRDKACHPTNPGTKNHEQPSKIQSPSLREARHLRRRKDLHHYKSAEKHKRRRAKEPIGKYQLSQTRDCFKRTNLPAAARTTIGAKESTKKAVRSKVFQSMCRRC